MLTVLPKSWLSWDFRVLEDGVELALIDRDWFRERASFSLDGYTYDVRRTSVVRGTFVLDRSGAVLAEAVKPSSFRRTFEISVGPERYRLEAVSMFGREFRLLRGTDPVGAIRPVSFLRRHAQAEFPESMPREVQLFIAFLVLVLWKRAADAAASG
jgi:hypothetical protein